VTRIHALVESLIKNPHNIINRRYSNPLLLSLVGNEGVLNFVVNVVYTMASYASTLNIPTFSPNNDH
jgi:hypothetical protein